ncbi:hypothetical protein JK2ML_1945 [Mycobacterium leprae Kyoto-2]|uniref:Secreted protein n=3 Tax=Mycobacterium leprae TaxID=1769 RepID=Q7AQ15_MYCLE|nr:DUF4245 domain-containing protein [Mycobacterium leprae]OAR19878.1 hypothetical protein A8144_13210 [Mycobacterium leprae 3125609]OAX70227.1 hypothetical protein A3216_13165 [Mycobacterium leprae 7935681]CAR72042.1 conserved hypothetical protein [Mycobacterium leprae Br4923]BBC17475.1 hypothetical protein JK2ML_1945 [Mycobacterium leprae Kyoto-2]
MVNDCPRSRSATWSWALAVNQQGWDTRRVTFEWQPNSEVANKPGSVSWSAKPRLLQDGRDMFWSLVPLVVGCILLAGMAGTCTFAPGGTTKSTVSSYDAAAALRADARALGFPVRLPELPTGWRSNSGSRGSIEDGRMDLSTGKRLPAVTSTVGYITPTGMYLSLTQSNADEDRLVASIHPSSHPTGTVDVAGTKWVVYQGSDQKKDHSGAAAEPVWTSRFASPVGAAQIAITGAGCSSQFRMLASATQSQQPLPAR